MLKAIQLFFVVFISQYLASCSNSVVVDKSISDINKRLDNYLELAYQNNQFPGIQYIVFNKDKVLYEYSGGYAKIDAKEKMTPNSVLNVFSTTKVITGIAILQLAQQGKLSVYDKVAKYFPDLPYKDITIIQVLSHSSGITNALLGNFYVHWVNEHKNYDRDAELLSVLKENIELNFNPGQEIGYSNMGYAILGKVIENVSELKYEDYVTKYIFNKLKLNSKKINFNSQKQKDSALPYFKSFSLMYNIMVLFLDDSETKNEGEWISINPPFYFNHPSHGGIVASSGEYAKIFMDLMKNEKSILLSPESIKQMFTNQIRYDDTSMAVSWFMGKMNKKPYFYHQGSGMGYVAEVRIYPEENIGSIILMNRTEYDALSMLNILDAEFISDFKKK